MSLIKQRQSVENTNDEEEEESIVNTNNKKPNHHLLNQTKKQIQIDEFQSELNHNLIKFRNENLFTDIYIYVEGVEFPCHKVILCASSSYFKAMFSCDLKESRLGKVFIENISSWTMKRLLDFIYTGKIEINYDNVIDIFNAAAMFQLYKLADKCTDYIEEHIDLTNCIDIHVFASLHQLQKLEKDTFQFILDNFMQLINALPSVPVNLKSTQAQSFLDDLNLTNQLINCVNSMNTSDTVYFSDFVLLSESSFQSLIKSDLLNVSREIYVYYAVKKWIEYQMLACKHSASKLNKMYENLFKHIRLNALNKDELEFILKNDKLVNSNPMLLNHLKSFLNDYFKQDDLLMSKLDSKLETLTQIESNNIRPSTIPREYLCLLELNQFQFYDFYKSKWDLLTSWPPSTSQSRSTLMPFQSPTHSVQTHSNLINLNGYSTCIVNNMLYVLGGYTNQIDNLVDYAWRFDPIKNEWTSCCSMLRKRAFHLSISLNATNATSASSSSSSSSSSIQSSKENNFIFLFYGICYLNTNDHTHNESAPQIRTLTSILTQCLSIDYYNIHTDQWCALVSTNSSLLNHHIFQSLNNLNRSILNNATNAESDDLNLTSINQLIENQLTQSKTIVSLKNLIYILKENCINCYEFNSDLEQLICLPYFRLPTNLSTFSLATALPVKITASNYSSSSNLFSWYSDNEESLLSSPQQANKNLESMLKSDLDFSSLLKHQDDLIEATSQTSFVTAKHHKKEALIYLINPQKRTLYEFYPARNKLKKLPNLTLKHLPNETFVLNIKSKLYVTGGLVEPASSASGTLNEAEHGNLIEVLDEDRASWTIFKQNFATNSSITTTNTTLKLTKHFFKLKMSLV